MSDDVRDMLREVVARLDAVREDVSQLRARDEERERAEERFWSTEWPRVVVRVEELQMRASQLHTDIEVMRARDDERQQAARLSGAGAGTVSGVLAGALSATVARLLGL